MFVIRIAEMTSFLKLGKYLNAFQRKDLGTYVFAKPAGLCCFLSSSFSAFMLLDE